MGIWYPLSEFFSVCDGKITEQWDDLWIDLLCVIVIESNESPKGIDKISRKELDEAIRFTANWKAPGNDGIQGYYWKYLTNIRESLLVVFNRWYIASHSIPDDLLRGRTILLYKKGDPKNPANYRPITCLNTITKIFTSVLKNKIEKILSTNPDELRISPNQLGCKKKNLASKEGIFKNYIMKNKLNTKNGKYLEAYYDIKKAYDSVNHKWTTACLR